MTNIKSNLSLILLSMITLAGCNTNLSQTELLNQNLTKPEDNTVQAQFARSSESDEILIDEEYYKSFPDKQLSQDISQIQNGVIPEEVNTAPVDQIKAQSFFSLFNKKATLDIYDSYGTPEKFTVLGRVYSKKSITPELTSDSKLRNIFRNIKYFTPKGIENIEVNVIAAGLSRISRTDNKGYFKVEFNNSDLQPGISSLSAKLIANKYKYETPKEELTIDKADSEKIGIISDFDDTVKHTSADKTIQMIKGILIGNYKTDKAIPGVSSLYKGILSNPQSTGFDCVHYVTGSPTNLYLRVQNFLKLNGFPQGSMSMKSPGSRLEPTVSDTFSYKVAKIRPIINAYPNKKFVLFGDTTQKDTEVYLKIKQEFPKNVAGIYINNATKANPADPKYNGVMVTDSAIDAAQDLLKKGIITQEAVDRVISDIK